MNPVGTVRRPIVWPAYCHTNSSPRAAWTARTTAKAATIRPEQIMASVYFDTESAKLFPLRSPFRPEDFTLFLSTSGVVVNLGPNRRLLGLLGRMTPACDMCWANQ